MMTDPFVHDDAAYVLGLLDEAERSAFELHLITCAACRARVAEIGAMPDLLASVPADEVDDPVPATLLPRLLREVAASRTRRRWFSGALAAVAAACLIAVTVLAWPTPARHAATQAVGRPMTAISQSAVSATIQLDQRGWGTEIDLVCHYRATGQSGYAYGLVVYDTDGTRYDLGTWALTPGSETEFRSGVALPVKHIARVQVTAAGAPILQLTT